jgi:phosphate transport system substrate-binding protein
VNFSVLSTMNKKSINYALGCGLLAATIASIATANTATQVRYLAQANNSGNTTIKIDGSSTVFPITQAIAKEFQANPANKAQVEVKVSGTTGGFEKFCTGKTNINNASRPILQAEMATCKKNGVQFMEFPIAFDALSVVVNPQNDWAKDITIAELKKMWEPAAQGKITKWNQVRSTWPDRPLKLFGADDKSGTFDYFTEATVGKSKASRKDYTPSEDDDKLVSGISADPNALGYFGFAYYQQNKSKLKLLAVDSGKGATLPSIDAVVKNQYQPLSRPLFIYVNLRSSPNRQLLGKFVEQYINSASKIASTVGYIPLPDRVRELTLIQFNRGKTGTVFGGKASLTTKISDLLQQKADN